MVENSAVSIAALRRLAFTAWASLRRSTLPIADCTSVKRRLVPIESCTHRNDAAEYGSFINCQFFPWSLKLQTLFQRTRSFVTTIPPSPPVEMILSWQNEN